MNATTNAAMGEWVQAALRQAVRELRGYEYRRGDLIHQSSLADRCMCARCIEARADAALASQPAPAGGGLDFEPDDMHTVADMANVGYSLMQAIKRERPGYAWNESPAEIVGDLINELAEATQPPAPQSTGAVEPKGDLLDPDTIATVCRDLGELESDGWIVAGVARKIIQLTTPPADAPQSTGAGVGERALRLLESLESCCIEAFAHESWKAASITIGQHVPLLRAAIVDINSPPADAVAVDDAMVERAEGALRDYWKDTTLFQPCPDCKGIGKIPCGDSQEWCDCGGGTINTGNDSDALRAAIQAALNPAEGGK